MERVKEIAFLRIYDIWFDIEGIRSVKDESGIYYQ